MRGAAWALVALVALACNPDGVSLERRSLFHWHQYGLDVSPVEVDHPGRCYRVDHAVACFTDADWESARAGVSLQRLLWSRAVFSYLDEVVAIYDADLDHARRLIAIGHGSRSMWPGLIYRSPQLQNLRVRLWRAP